MDIVNEAIQVYRHSELGRQLLWAAGGIALVAVFMRKGTLPKLLAVTVLAVVLFCCTSVGRCAFGH